MPTKPIILAVVFLLFGFLQTGAAAVDSQVADDAQFSAFAMDLDAIRQALKIPGMSAAVVRDQQLVWGQGFGYANLEEQVAATADTPYGLASVTKPIAATLMMQLVEEGAIDLDAPVNRYGVHVEGEEMVTVRHLLTHTSEGIPGTSFRYNGDRYALLGGVMEGATGESFAELLGQRFLIPLGMENSALNPINSWGSIALPGLDEFRSTMGWGNAFRHYPTVYSRLARPYQFDEEYNIIPGMYHMRHNPAAGMISSVTDLAAFDIALDQGQLLGEAAKAEMFSPAFSTYGGRQDLMYGLGWYAQTFEGLQLLWHTGRWPPSTSALYLKVPELDLSFIVLANTDNLTTPFDGLGNGDVSKSLLTLSFFRHFIFPVQHGHAPTVVDWQAEEEVLIAQLSPVEEKASQVFLERELWSYRQSFASVGRFDLVDRLLRVNQRVFRLSTFRRDPLFTSTAGQFPVIPATMSIETMVWLSRATAFWLALVLLSLLWMGVRLARGKEWAPWRWGMWLLSTLLLGPIALLVQAQLRQRAGDSPTSRWQLSAGASCFTIAAYALAWALVISLVITSPTDPHPLLILVAGYLAPLLVALALIQVPQVMGRGTTPTSRFSRVFLLELIKINVGFAVLFPLTMVVQESFLSTLPSPTSPYFGAMMSLLATVGLLALFPLHYWMSRRGFAVWPVDKWASVEGAISFPAWRDSWWMWLATLGIMIVALAWTAVAVA